MADERQSPDAILAMTGLTGAVGDVQDDPDSPDGNWLAADSNNVNTEVRVSLPTPTGNPTAGANLQEFRVLFRQFDEGQGGTPEGRIELWEDGLLIRAGSDVSIPDGGVVVSFTWNANELANADGSLVEINIVGTKSGGSPGNRNSTEVGAVEWNVDYVVGAEAVEGTAAGSGIGLATSGGLVEVIGQAQANGIGSLVASASLVVLASANGEGAGLADALAYLEITGQAYGEGIGLSEALGELDGNGNGAPYNIEFCRAIEEGPEHCPHLKENDMCALTECIYNFKWVKYWETYGIYPPEGVEDA